MKEKIILIGGGGHCKVVIDAIRRSGEFSVYGILDPKLAQGTAILGCKVVGTDDDLKLLFKKGIKKAFITVGSIGNCDSRKRIYSALKNIGFDLPVIMHEKAIVADDVEIGEGTFVAARAVINSGTNIGRNVIINTSSSVDHDCKIGDFVHIAPGATLSGGVRIGAETHVGTGANIIQYINIGKRCMIGAGSTVRHHVADGAKYFERVILLNEMKRDKKDVFIIAEAGVNHNGRLALAKKLVDAARSAGADAIKFQTFRAEALATHDAPKAGYQKGRDSSKTQFEMLKKLELSEDEFRKLFDYCRHKKIMFLSTPFDEQSAQFLERIGVACFKVSSGDVTNIPLLVKIAQYGKPIILSTGMSSLDEVRYAVKAIYSTGNRKLTLLHCTSNYPSEYKDVNLRAMITLRDAFKVPIGYSDHTLGIDVPIAAATLGASVIEKHLTLDKDMKGPDHRVSLEPDEFKAMVRGIRNIAEAMGSRVKKAVGQELNMRKIARKSIVAARDIATGDKIEREMLMVKRPGTGIGPKDMNKLLGMKAKRFISIDELITWGDIK